MAISRFHASTILEVRASFGFSNFSCDPDQISRQLGIAPDQVRRKAENPKGVITGGAHVRALFNSWHISSGSDSKDVNDHLRDLLSRLQVPRCSFDPTWGRPSFSVVWKGTYLHAGSGPFYEADVLAGIAALGADLFQDIYHVDQPEDELT